MQNHDDGRRAKTEQRLWESFNRIKAEGRPTGPAAFAKENGINRSYFYTFHELAAAVAEYGKKTQPGISRRGAGIGKADAKKRDVSERVRREHTRWAREIPELREQLAQAEGLILSQKNELTAEKASKQRLMRAYELLLMMASEAGASPLELERIQQSLSACTDISAGKVIRASGIFGA